MEGWDTIGEESHAAGAVTSHPHRIRKGRAMSHLYAVALAFAVAGSAGAQDPGRAALQGQQTEANSKAGQRAEPARLIPVPGGF